MTLMPFSSRAIAPLSSVTLGLALPVIIAITAIAALTAPRVAIAAETAPATKRVNVEEYDALRSKTNTVLLDVRSPAEFEKGHIPGAVNLDINSTQFTAKAETLDKSKTYLVNCAVGMRSARACKKLETMGFTNLVDLAPGFDGWKKAGKPVQK